MILYISKEIDDNIGARLHQRAIRNIIGEKEVFTIYLSPTIKQVKQTNYISYGKYKNKTERIRRWLQGNMMFISNGIIDELCNIIKDNNIKTVFIEDSVFGNFVKKVKSIFPDVKVISFYHDIKANLYRQWNKKSNFIGKIENNIGIRQENINQKFCDINLVFNQRDADLFHSIYGKYPEGIVPLPAPIPQLDEEYMDGISEKSQKKVLLFVGKKYYPNIVGIEWFYKNVLPRLDDNFEFQIVGRGLEYLRDELTDPHVNVIGEVDSLDAYYKNADIVIAPLFDGGGMKSKTVEAVSFGKTFVGTAESLFGFWEEMGDSIKGKSVYMCNTPEDWINTLNFLINNKIQKFNSELFDLFVQKFSYEAIREQLKKYLIN